MVMQQKTGQPVQFEITEQTRESISSWINHAELMSDEYLFSSRNRSSNHISTRQYARLVRVRYALDATHKSIANISPNKKSQSSANTAGSHKDGKYHQISGHRGGRCSGDGRTDRNLASKGPETPPGAFRGLSKADTGKIPLGDNFRPILLKNSKIMRACFSADNQSILNSSQHLACRLTICSVDRDR
jgi:hypothetical protein